MNKNQWIVFGWGFILLSMYLFNSALDWGSCMAISENLMTSCVVRRYLYAVPAIISVFLGMIFLICSFFEKK